jgi:hypothetical protein
MQLINITHISTLNNLHHLPIPEIHGANAAPAQFSITIIIDYLNPCVLGLRSHKQELLSKNPRNKKNRSTMLIPVRLNVRREDYHFQVTPPRLEKPFQNKFKVNKPIWGKTLDSKSR